MLLYKYYGPESGFTAMVAKKLGFRTPTKFNDPFELTALNNCDGFNTEVGELRRNIDYLRNNVAILSLTRSPFNPLMWAHYGIEHTGVVLEYEVVGEFFNSPALNFVTANMGDVIYANTKNQFRLAPSAMLDLAMVCRRFTGGDSRPTHGEESIIRKLFLTKHSSWSYEEEVRVVKFPGGINNYFPCVNPKPMQSLIPSIGVDGLYIYEYEVPPSAVFLGANNKWDHDQEKTEALRKMGCPVYKLYVNDASWDLVPNQII